MEKINWTAPEIIGAIIAAIVGLLGVIFTIRASKKSSTEAKASHVQSQISNNTSNTNQYQAGRDINLKPTNREEDNNIGTEK